jgi:hypothetical protein
MCAQGHTTEKKGPGSISPVKSRKREFLKHAHTHIQKIDACINEHSSRQSFHCSHSSPARHYNVSVESLLVIVVVDSSTVHSGDKWPLIVCVVDRSVFEQLSSRDAISQPNYERVVAIHDETLFQ